MAKSKEAMASVLAYEKKIVPSDARMYGTIWEARHSERKPLNIIEKSVRGTISNRLSAAQKNDPSKIDAEVEKANLQKVDSCGLSMEQDTLCVEFTLKILSGVEHPSACNSVQFLETYQLAAQDYIRREKFSELGKRYAVNIANGRFLWRNRFGADSVEIKVEHIGSNEHEESVIFNAFSYSVKSFDTDDTDVLKLGNEIAEVLSGKVSHKMFKISAYAKVGLGQEVYPSEELVLDKGKGKKGKVLFDINGVAGMHSQKIGNAVRTIDTWYPEYADSTVGPIAVEPYGAVTTLGKAFRTPKNKSDFYTLFDSFARGGKLSGIEEEHYVMAVLVRGGVFGESSKE